MIARTLTEAVRIFRGDENQSPLFIQNQKIPGSPKENQLANNETFSMVSAHSRCRRSAYNQTKKVVKHRNSHGNDPGNDPKRAHNADPRPDSHEVFGMNAVRSGEQSDVD